MAHMPERETHLLLVEDEGALRSATAEQLRASGYAVDEASSGDAALEQIARFAYDAIITDLRLPGASGSDVLGAALERYPDIPVIVVTGFGTVRDAVAAIRLGAADFITKPFQFDELLHVMQGAIERRRLRAENQYLRQQLDRKYGFEGLVGRSGPMRELAAILETVAPSNSTILILGETGTGKELVARAIHQNSARKTQRFVALNCSAVPETLLEGELFGHVKGAFTGAIGPREGRFEAAHRGTLFLDEVGTMSGALQAKLLRVLQERSFERVGESQSIKVDVRVIAATNSNLLEMVRTGAFREDLYYRLNVIQVSLPPLRDRRDDIPLLVQHFLERMGAQASPPRSGVAFSQEALRCLMAHHWPGNVRELENIVERAFIMSPGRLHIDVSALPAPLRAQASAPDASIDLPDAGVQFDDVMARIERGLLARALARTGGNRMQAAALLGLKRTTLVEKLKRLGMMDADAGSAAKTVPTPPASAGLHR